MDAQSASDRAEHYKHLLCRIAAAMCWMRYPDLRPGEKMIADLLVGEGFLMVHTNDRLGIQVKGD